MDDRSSFIERAEVDRDSWPESPRLTFKRVDAPRPLAGPGWLIAGDEGNSRYFRVTAVDGKLRGSEVPAEEVPDEVKAMRHG